MSYLTSSFMVLLAYIAIITTKKRTSPYHRIHDRSTGCFVRLIAIMKEIVCPSVTETAIREQQHGFHATLQKNSEVCFNHLRSILPSTTQIPSSRLTVPYDICSTQPRSSYYTHVAILLLYIQYIIIILH